MRLDSPSLTLHLQPRQVVNLPKAGPAGVSVSVTSGSVWITEDRRSDDIVLEPGQSHRSQRRSGLMIYGLGAAEIRIEDGDAVAPSGLDA